MKADGSNLKRLTDSTIAAFYPVWSPDGTKIAFHANLGIYVMSSEGKDVKRLSHAELNGGLSWSPDGKKIVFRQKTAKQVFDIYTMNPDGSQVQKLTKGLYSQFQANYSPRWSPSLTEAPGKPPREDSKKE